MLCRRLKRIISTNSSSNYKFLYNSIISSRYISKKCIWFDNILSTSKFMDNMTSTLKFRLLLRGLSVIRLWNPWSRSYLVNSVFKRYRRDRGVREVLQCIRQTFLRPKRTFLISATAAYKNDTDEEVTVEKCEKSITDDDLQRLIADLELVQELAKQTLFCTKCGKRLVIDKKHPGITYCGCKEPEAEKKEVDGWVPYMEANDVILWRKQHERGPGLYAYKVYGRYKEVQAQDYASVQIDGAYRRTWDASVAALAVVEKNANGVCGQTVLHWEVLWPKLFANRDYVYIRRHIEYEKRFGPSQPIFTQVEAYEPPPEPKDQNVHSKAKRKAMEEDWKNRQKSLQNSAENVDNKVFVIISRSCSHPKVPETKHTIRVHFYWSDMVIRSLEGASKPGMEFVLTYYDEPAVGGLPTVVANWAAARAGPAYLDRMRKAASEYRAYRNTQTDELPDFAPTYADDCSEKSAADESKLSEQEMKTSNDGPDMENGQAKQDTAMPTSNTKDKSTQTDDVAPTNVKELDKNTTEKTPDKPKVKSVENIIGASERDGDKTEGESDKVEEENNGSWWRDSLDASRFYPAHVEVYGGGLCPAVDVLWLK